MVENFYDIQIVKKKNSGARGYVNSCDWSAEKDFFSVFKMVFI